MNISNKQPVSRLFSHLVTAITPEFISGRLLRSVNYLTHSANSSDAQLNEADWQEFMHCDFCDVLGVYWNRDDALAICKECYAIEGNG